MSHQKSVDQTMKAKTNQVEVHVDADPALPDIGRDYMHCSRCLEEWTESFRGTCTPKEYARQQTSIAADGRIQVWCVRHNCNIRVFTFKKEGRS